MSKSLTEMGFDTISLSTLCSIGKKMLTEKLYNGIQSDSDLLKGKIVMSVTSHLQANSLSKKVKQMLLFLNIL